MIWILQGSFGLFEFFQMDEEMEEQERAVVERELSRLMEMTLALEDELNHIFVIKERN